MDDSDDFKQITCTGRVWTRQELIDSINAWICPATGQHVTFVKFGRDERRNPVVYLMLPGGEIIQRRIRTWTRGFRPDASVMQRGLFKRQAEEYGLFDVKVFNDKNGSHLRYKFPDGTEGMSQFSNWSRGARPSKSRMQQARVIVEAQELGLTEPRIDRIDGFRSLRLLYNLPCGEPANVSLSGWLRGKRPKKFDLEKHLYPDQFEQYGLSFVGYSTDRAGETVIRFKYKNGCDGCISPGAWRAGQRPDPEGRNVGYICGRLFKEQPELINKPAYLYYRRFFDPTKGELFYKIGVSRKGTRRYGHSDGPYKITTIEQIETTLYDAWERERQYLSAFSANKYTPSAPLRGAGDTECFSIDVLGLDEDFDPNASHSPKCAA